MAPSIAGLTSAFIGKIARWRSQISAEAGVITICLPAWLQFYKKEKNE